MLTSILRLLAAVGLIVALPSVALGYSPNTDLTTSGAIAALKADPNASFAYTQTYNLGATGLRGWIYVDTNNKDSGSHGLLTALSRQILVTVAAAPGNSTMAVDDVILGATTADSGTVPLFTSDCRKAFGTAIGLAEAKNPAVLRVKRWRAGAITDVSITLSSMGSYSATSPFVCEKSDRIIAQGRANMVSKLLNNSNYPSRNYSGAIEALAILAVVKPTDSDYIAVQAKLKAYANRIVAADLSPQGNYMWDWSYMCIFLSEYYLCTVADGTPDTSVLAGISRNTMTLANSQSRYGTYGHGGSLPKADGSPNGTVPPYGPVNSVGIPTNIAIVLGKKALIAGSVAVAPQIDQAIARGAKFFAYYMNKGSIPYGEHEPWISGHGSNGKDPMCAVLFGLQSDRPAEAEYFSRMALAGCTGREYGHTGQEFSYLWGVMGANVGGPTATIKYMENIRWQLDLARRTDGSFAYGGKEQFGAGSTTDGTYLGPMASCSVDPTASYLLSYGVAMKRLYLTGKGAIPANALTLAKVTNAIAAATYKQDCLGYTTPQLLAALNEYDPIVRNDAAVQLAGRALDAAQVASLLSMVTDMTNANGRMGACQTLGLRKNAAALPLLNGRLSDPDLWVRAKATIAIRNYNPVDVSVYRDSMLKAFTDNATDPEVIVWDDPVQVSNRYLSLALFGNAVSDGTPGNNIADYTQNAPKDLLYRAVRVALKQPDSYPRSGAALFVEYRLSLADVQQLALDIFKLITEKSQADTMWYYGPQLSGMRTLLKYKCAEAIPIALSMLKVEASWGWDSTSFMPPYMDALKYYGDLARWTLPTLENEVTTSLKLLHPSDFASLQPQMQATIASIRASTTPLGGIINLLPIATPQFVATTGAKAIILAGTSPRSAVTFSVVTAPAHGTLAGTAPNLTYTPTSGYSGPDHFSFKVTDTLTTSEPGTVSIIVGAAGTGMRGEYYDNADFTNLKLTRIDPQVDFNWAAGSPASSIAADTFSVRWTGQLLVPETGNYTFSTLNSDGVRLYVNGIPMINDYTNHDTAWNDSASVRLTAGQKVELQLEYYENTGLAVAKLKWTGPTFAGRNGLIIAKEWLYDGTGLVGRVPYAHAQSLSMIQNADQALTLAGSGGNQTPLTYSIVTQPAHGTLSGTAPNLIFRPTSGYSGTDSFTFMVNNGNADSAPATVSFGILVGQPVAYFWSQAVTGNWSGNYWTNAAGGSVIPAVLGSAAYNLNFNQPGTYTASHDLSDNFEFNQLNFAAAVTIGGGKSLLSSVNGPFLPQINQNGSTTVKINSPLKLGAMTTLGGTGNGRVGLPALVSGLGGLIIDSSGTLELYGLVPNTYSGGTIVNSGTLHLGAVVADVSPACINPVGSGPVTLNNGGTIEFDRVSAGNALTANGGILFTPNGWGASWTGPITLNSNLTCDTPNRLVFSGIITGVGGLTKIGNGPLTLSGVNTYSGSTFVKAGILQSAADALGTGLLDIASGAKVGLNFTGTRTIAALKYNSGTSLEPGTYGSSASPATNKNDNYFSGTGMITIAVPTFPSVLPVVNGLVLRMDASQIAGTSNGAQVNTWNDVSGAWNHAIRQEGSSTGYPQYVSNGINGLPVVRFNSGIGSGGDFLKFNRISTIRSVFWVIKENTNLSDGHFLLGDNSTYDFHRGLSANRPLWDANYSAANIRNGTTKLMGNPVAGTTTSLPSGSFQLVSLVTSGNVSADQLCQDRTFHGSWQGDIAELLIYDRALTSEEENQVGTYLGYKYGLATSYGGLPVTNGLVLQMDASKIAGIADGAQLNTWNDTSGAANNAIRQNGSSGGYPKYVASAVNGLPVVRFNSGNSVAGDSLKFNRITNIRSVFWVLKENAGLIDSHFLLGDDSSYHFHRGGNNGPVWDSNHADSKVKNGITKLMGSPVVGTTTSLPSGSFQLLSLVTTGDVEANQICQDRTFHGSWQGDIAEVLIYNRALTSAEETVVGTYLAAKYRLSTGYPLTGVPSVPTAVSAAADGAGAIRVTWAPVLGAASYKVWSRNTLTSSEQVVVSSDLLCLVSGLAVGTPYEFKVSAVYQNAVSGNYSSQAIATPLGVSSYFSWAGNAVQGLTAGMNSDPLDDPDRDGISNLMEFSLGSAPMTPSSSNLPTLSKTAEGWVFEYSRSDLSRTGTTQVVEYSNDFTVWTPIPVPEDSSIGVVITQGSPSDIVKVAIPSTVGKPAFARLKVTQ